jgi:hypothetical protein
MDELRFNVEAWHEEWLGAYERLAMDYFAGPYGRNKVPEVPAMLVAFNPDDDGEDERAIYDCLGSFSLPGPSSDLILLMARFCQVDLFPPDKILNSPFKLSEFPEGTFLLSSLLEASFPKNTRSGIFRGHNGGILLGYEHYDEAMEDLGKNAALACVFAGLGVRLMNACRPFVDASAPDSEIIQKGENIYLCILEGKPGEEKEAS